MKRTPLKRKTPLKRGGPIRRKKPMSRRPKQSIGKAKAEAWKWFSRYIRLRDSKPIDPENGDRVCRCVTCAFPYPMKSIQAGHFIPGRHNALIYDERNCHAQCRTCNVFRHGNWVSYERYMRLVYGELVVQELKDKDRLFVSMDAHDHLAVAEVYRGKVAGLGGWPE